MARIPDTEIERIKREVSVERLIEASGIALKRTGKDLFGRCPFHADDTASLSVTPAKNLWHCLGACQTGGSVIDWVMRINGISFRHAVELLRADPTLAASPKPVRQGTVPKLPAPVALDADDRKLLAQVVDYYHETLKSSPEALSYLQSRGLDDAGAIERFKLGFANRTLGLRLPEKNRVAGAEIRARLQKLGVLRESGHEHFNGSLVIPVIDAEGTVTELYGRKITAGLRPGTPLHLYLPRAGLGIGRGVWNIEALRTAKEIIVCEALIDALSFWCAGYRNVTAAYGVEGFTDDHFAAMKQHGTSRVLIAYDRDEAGEKAAERLASRLMAEGIECYRILFPKGMDANEYALKLAPASKSLGLAIRKAVWLGKGHAPARADSSLAAKEQRIAESELEAIVAPEREVAMCDLKVTPVTTVSGAQPHADSDPLPVSAGALPASPVPPAPPTDIAAEVSATEVALRFGPPGDERRYRVRGLAKNGSAELLRVNVLVGYGERFHVDTLDLYQAKARAHFIGEAAAELKLSEELLRADLGRVIQKLEALQDELIRQALAPTPIPAVEIAEDERAAALGLLRDPHLIDRILADFEACGLTGERTNKLVGYLAATSRKLDQPLAVVIQSSSAAGKSSLMDAVLALIPEEERVKYSAMTGQSLFYMNEMNLKHKVLAIVEEEGASRAAYALKLLQSEGELTIASTGKDPSSGELKAQTYRVEGPVMIVLTTTAIEIDEELMNRCLMLSVDENRAQTQAIHRLQREKRTLEGLIARTEREEILKLHRNAQRLLKPLKVLNPYARHLTFPDEMTRTRRDHEKYLTLIDAIALLHQYQRAVKTIQRANATPIEYVEATLEDIALAHALAHEVLGRSLDELPAQTRRLLHRIEAFVQERAITQQVSRTDFRFSRRTLREHTGLSDTQLRLHLERLVAMEYLIAHRDGSGGRFVYELVYDGQGKDGKPFLTGLIDLAALRSTGTMPNSRGQPPELAPRLRADRGPVAGGSREAESPATQPPVRDSRESSEESAETHVLQTATEILSYPNPSAPSPASGASPALAAALGE